MASTMPGTDEQTGPTSEGKVDFEEKTSQTLFRWNLGTGIVQFITSLILFGITDYDTTLPIYTNYPGDGSPRDTGNWDPSPEHLDDVRPGYYSAVFLLLSALDHLLVATLVRSAYERCVRQATNPFRWAEYSISASVMHMFVGNLSGMLDIHLMLAVFFLTAITMVFGYLQEEMNKQHYGSPAKKTFFPFWIGFVPHIVNWGIVCSYFFEGVSSGDPPNFVWAIIFVVLLLDGTFAINQYLQQKEISYWKDYIRGELIFIVLSLTSKQLLAWINYGGARSV